MELHHSEAFNYGANKVLRDKDGYINYNLRKEDKKQLEMAKHMGDYYLDKSKEFFKSKIDGKDELENEMITNAYARITTSQLNQIINQLKERFTLDQFNAHKHEIVKAVREQFKGIARGD